jgi:two-component system OmpR family response regulator
MFAEAPALRPITQSAGDTTPDRLRVLCVDDFPDSADTLAALLDIFGCDAKSCYDGVTALWTAADFRPDACLIDLNMPGMDGDEVASRIRRLFPRNTPVLIAVTAQGDDIARQRTTRAGFDRHLVKPVDPDELAATVADLTIAARLSHSE